MAEIAERENIATNGLLSTPVRCGSALESDQAAQITDSVAVPACLFLNKPTQEPREPTVAGSSSAGALGNGEHSLIAQVVRFARPNIQIYDAHVVDLYQWVCPPKARVTTARGRKEIERGWNTRSCEFGAD